PNRSSVPYSSLHSPFANTRATDEGPRERPRLCQTDTPSHDGGADSVPLRLPVQTGHYTKHPAHTKRPHLRIGSPECVHSKHTLAPVVSRLTLTVESDVSLPTCRV